VPGDGVEKAQPVRVERLALKEPQTLLCALAPARLGQILGEPITPVERVAHDRIPQPLAVDADLVRASGVKPQCQHGGDGEALQHSVFGA
jgi:hypothetical protein